jgi:monomeric sarcosine oxidase
VQRSYDAIVMGIGGMGAAALWHLARRGVRVLGLEQFAIGHDRGSSHGQTRLIRQAYFEHPDYVPLLRRAYTLWAELEATTSARLFEPTGLVTFGPADGGRVLPGVIAAVQAHSVPIEVLDEASARAQFPQFRAPERYRAVVEPGAGFLHVERCVQAHVAAAVACGAEVRTGERVSGWQADGDGVVVTLRGGETVRAGRLVVAQGAWSGPLLRELGADLKVHRNALVWLRPRADKHAYHGDNTRHCFAFDLPEGFFYGFPALDDLGVKAALHHPGDPVADPDLADAPPTAADAAPVVAFARACLPHVLPEVTKIVTCRYELSPDEHFVVDRHPRWPQVVVAGGFSGHGFKFASVVGEALADFALQGRTDLPVGFLSARRFQSTGVA